jgi:hypothetical protein
MLKNDSTPWSWVLFNLKSKVRVFPERCDTKIVTILNMSADLRFSCQRFCTIRMKAGIHDIFLFFSFPRYKVVIVNTYCYFRDALPKSWQCVSIAS